MPPVLAKIHCPVVVNVVVSSCPNPEAPVMPTRTLSELSIVIAVASALSSIPVEVKPDKVPTLVILGCAAVASVPVIAPEAVIAPVILISPVPVISLEFKSKSPPS